MGSIVPSGPARTAGSWVAEDNAACVQEANGKTKPDHHVASVTVPVKKNRFCRKRATPLRR